MSISLPKGKAAQGLLLILPLVALGVIFSNSQSHDLTLPKEAVSSEGPGMNVGERIPALRTQDQKGNWRDFASLVGPRGAVILFYRSADW